MITDPVVCPVCRTAGKKSKVYPLRETADPFYEGNMVSKLQQLDCYWDEEGKFHSHMELICSNNHRFRDDCGNCDWGEKVNVKAGPIQTGLPPAPPLPVAIVSTVVPPAPPMLVPPMKGK